jgi:hypothetical protein
MQDLGGGLDAQVQSKVDAYRNNPDELQRRYQMGQDLLDLLALQRIKQEKESAKREIEMSMQQNPQTIRDQREQEVLGLTKEELGRQVGGIMAQRQAMQQRNLQNASMGAPPQQRILDGGVASAPAPNMARMAGGGIVAFAEGGYTGPITEDTLRSVNLTGKQYDEMSPEDQARVRQAIGERQTIGGIGEWLGRAAATVPISVYEVIRSPFYWGSRGIGYALRGTGALAPTTRLPLEEEGLTPLTDKYRLLNQPTATPRPGEKPPVPAIEAPAIEAPAIEAPAIEAPAIEAPAQVPAHKAPAPTYSAVAERIDGLLEAKRPQLITTPTSLDYGNIVAPMAADRAAAQAQQQEALNLSRVAAVRDPEEVARQRAATLRGVGQEADVLKIQEDILKQQRDLAAAQAARRKSDPWAWTQNLRTTSGWGAIGRGIRSAQAAEDARELADLNAQIATLQGMATTKKEFGKEYVVGARGGAEGAEVSARQAAANMAQMAGDAFKRLSDAERDRITVAIKNLDAASAAKVADLQAETTMRGQDLDALVKQMQMENASETSYRNAYVTMTQEMNVALANNIKLRDEAIKDALATNLALANDPKAKQELMDRFYKTYADLARKIIADYTPAIQRARTYGKLD